MKRAILVGLSLIILIFFNKIALFLTPYAKGLYFHAGHPSPVTWNGIEFSYTLRTKYAVTDEDISFMDVIAEPRGSATILKLKGAGWVDSMYAANNSDRAIDCLADSFIQDGYEAIKKEDIIILGKKRTFLILKRENDYLAHTYIPEQKVIMHYTGEPSGYDHFKHLFQNAKMVQSLKNE